MNDSDLASVLKSSMGEVPPMKITIACPMCKERMDTLESPGTTEVICRSCSHQYSVRGRKIILDKFKYYCCPFCKALFCRGFQRPSGCCAQMNASIEAGREFHARVDKLNRDCENGDISQAEVDRRLDEYEQALNIRSGDLLSFDADIELDLPPQPQNMEQEIIEILRKGLSPDEIQRQIAAVSKKYAPPAPPPPPQPDRTKEMDADIAVVIQQGRKAGKSQSEINAEVEYIKQQYAKKQ